VSEIQAIAPVFLEALQHMARARPDLQFIIPAATPRLHARLRALLSRIDPAGSTVILLDGQARLAMAAADSVLVASGTATLEVALLRKPMVIAYRMAEVSYRIMRRMQMLPWIGLPNILCNEGLVPEFIQKEATPEALARAVLEQLDDASLRSRLAERFEDLHHRLRRDCGRRAAEVMLDLAQATRRAPPTRGST
jgi:lipid-A-disaccharide synthase